MGAKAVGQLQFDENQMSRGARLCVRVEDGDFYPKIVTPYMKAASAATEKHPSMSIIKKRHTNKESGDADIVSGVQDIDLSCDTAQTVEIDVQNNPLNWYGVLVPQSLKQCQSKFKRAAELSCKLASLKLKYSSLQQRYRDLKLQKHKLLNESLELSQEF